MAKIISSFFGIGFIRKGGGTVAAIITVLLWYYIAAILKSGFGENNILLQCIIIIVLFIIGVWCGNAVEADWGKDSYRVVLDEVLGMSIALFIIPVKWQTLLAALILFRIFDIGKPFFIRKMEKFHGGWGVMLDDVLAGIYANIILHIILQFRWL
ncbi:MAG: phosphatidylglycerophosphatase A [Arachidicoccus sp.]|nr:phosphatidylglycerophosphatase A [Arachidicoccus sp.]